ncbi:MAG: hypothetical protein J6K87_01500 [Clostridia bacterium]|nr:hypothetical protein [Clostridia bacterium]
MNFKKTCKSIVSFVLGTGMMFSGFAFNNYSNAFFSEKFFELIDGDYQSKKNVMDFSNIFKNLQANENKLSILRKTLLNITGKITDITEEVETTVTNKLKSSLAGLMTIKAVNKDYNQFKSAVEMEQKMNKQQKSAERKVESLKKKEENKKNQEKLHTAEEALKVIQKKHDRSKQDTKNAKINFEANNIIRSAVIGKQRGNNYFLKYTVNVILLTADRSDITENQIVDLMKRVPVLLLATVEPEVVRRFVETVLHALNPEIV